MSGRHRVPIWQAMLLALIATVVYWLSAWPTPAASRYADSDAESVVARVVKVPVEVTRVVEVTIVPPSLPTIEPELAVGSGSPGDVASRDRARVYGKGETVQLEQLSITLIDYEFSPESGPSRAAVRYALRFANDSAEAARVRLDLTRLSAKDSGGVRYVDLMAADCGQSAGLAQRETVELAPGSYSDVNYYLTREESCQSRVDAQAAYVDVELGPVRYEADTVQESPRLTFRLSR